MKKSITVIMLALVSFTCFLLIKTNSPSGQTVSTTAHSSYLISPLSTTTTTNAAISDTLSENNATPEAGTTETSTISISTSSEAVASTPTEHHVQIKAIPALSQLPELPNGCEAVAATMLLNWAGLPISKEEVAHALPTGDMPYENEYGAFVGANPKDVFVGDPFAIGYGIYHIPIAKLMNQWLPGHVRDLTGTSFDDLLGVIAGGSPAMIWATEHMDTPYWDLEWEDESGEVVPWYQPEHALLLTGWDDDYAYMNDPMTGKQEAYPLAAFREVWELMGSQAITIIT